MSNGFTLPGSDYFLGRHIPSTKKRRGKHLHLASMWTLGPHQWVASLWAGPVSQLWAPPREGELVVPQYQAVGWRWGGMSSAVLPERPGSSFFWAQTPL